MHEDDVRRAKLEKIKALDVQSYGERFVVSHSIAEALNLPDGTRVSVAGRLKTLRNFGKLIFADLTDRSRTGQISFQRGILNPEQFEFASTLLDAGDFIGVEGVVWTTKTGERTVQTQNLVFLSKAVRSLPGKWHGLKDRETQARHRYLDLIANEETRKRFTLRSKIVSFIRRFFDENGFVEVETPILQAASSGASARPFTTHHNALDRDLYLRISPETYLKRLMVGGLERIYELGKNFRNEGIDASHLQEFTMLEWYAAYWNFRDNMRFLQQLICAVLLEFCGGTTLRSGEVVLDFGGDWPEISYCKCVKQATGIDLLQYRTYETLADVVNKKFPEVEVKNFASLPALIDGLYKHVVRPQLIQPSFLIQHPAELVPLARRNQHDPRILDMFQLVVNSSEIAKGYSELIDPAEQYERMLEQQAYRAAGDRETMMLENDYIECMEFGMPPNSGVGVGIDRLVAFIVDAETLRDVVFFPSLREESRAEGEASVDSTISPVVAQKANDEVSTEGNS